LLAPTTRASTFTRRGTKRTRISSLTQSTWFALSLSRSTGRDPDSNLAPLALWAGYASDTTIPARSSARRGDNQELSIPTRQARDQPGRFQGRDRQRQQGSGEARPARQRHKGARE